MSTFRTVRKWVFRVILLLIVLGGVAALLGSQWERSEQAAFLASDVSAPGEMIRVGDQDLHVLALGEGSPGVLFISGLGDDHRIWRSVQGQVAESTLAVSYDRPGLGWSPASESDLTFDAAVQDVHALITDTGLFSEPPILVGHSLGGAIARRVAHTHPDALSGLVLVDATPTADIPSGWNALMGGLMRVQHASGAVGLQRWNLYRRYPDASREEHLLWGYLNANGARAREVRREFTGAVSSEPIPVQVGELGDLPLTGLVAPAQGPPFSGATTLRLDEVKRQMVNESRLGRLVEVQTGHYIHHEDPEAVTAAILQMIEVGRDDGR